MENSNGMADIGHDVTTRDAVVPEEEAVLATVVLVVLVIQRVGPSNPS